MLSNEETGDVHLDDTAEQITTYAKSTSPYQRYPLGYYTDGTDFDRSDECKHANDFRWVIDLASATDMPPGKVRLLDPGVYRTTTVYLENALMYTGELTPQPLLRVPSKTNPNSSSQGVIEFGHANDTIIAAIFGDKAELTVEIVRNTGTSDSLTLSASTNAHSIDLMNMRPTNASNLQSEHAENQSAAPTLLEGDFKLYYGAVAANEEWSLWGVPKAFQMYGSRIDCDSVTLGPGTP